MKLFFSFFLILQLLITPAMAQKICVQTNAQPLSKEQSKTTKDLVKKLVCLQDQSDLVLGKVMGSCLIEVIKGAFEFLVAQLEGIWDMLEMGYDLAKKFGSFITGYLKAAWNGTLPTFWAEQYHQGASFFGNLAKSLKEIPQMVTGFFQKESETFRCLPLDKKVDYICHAVGRVGPEVVLIAMGIYKGVGSIKNLAKSIYPKLIAMNDVEKGAIVARAMKIEEAAKASKIKALKTAKTIAKDIVENPRPAESYEYAKAGKIVKDSRDLKNLDEGAYLYVIDTKGNVAITKRFPDLSSSEKVLANHPALKEQLAQTVGKGEVAAAGEFYVDGGEIGEFNNKSGRFNGGQDHLDFAVETMKKKGLNIKEGTTLKEYKSLKLFDPEHIQEKSIAKAIQEKFATNPETVKEFNDFKDAYKNVYQNNPALRSSKKLGRLDSEKLANIAINYMEAHPEKDMGAMAAIYYADNAVSESSRQFKGFLGITNGTFSLEQRKEALEILNSMAKEGALP